MALSKNRELTRKRKLKFISEVIAGKTLTESAIAAGYNPKNAQSQASQLLMQANSKESFATILGRSGITEQKLSDRISALLDAEQSHFFNNGDSDIIERKSPAHETRRKTIELALKLLGHLKPDSAAPTVINNAGLMQVVISQLSQQKD